MAFAASIGEPPPMAIIQSGLNLSMASAPLITVSTDGSGSMPSKSSTFIPASVRYRTALSKKPNFFMEPPPTQIIAFLPLKVLSASSEPFPWYKSLGKVNLAIVNIPPYSFILF